MKAMIIGAAMALATPALAEDTITKTAPGSVTETMDALVAAVEAAGATVFARVDHAAGAASVGKALPEAQLLIFGNPALGTLAMEQDIRAGLVLPLRVLVYADGAGTTTLRYATAEEMFDDLDIPETAEVVAGVNAALNGLTDTAMSAN